MNVKEKLVELIAKAKYICANDYSDHTEDEYIADTLLDNGVTVQEWISVSSQPKERGEYLCYFKYEPESPNVICQNKYYGSGRWMSESDRIVYWMPLTPLPKGE